MAARTGLEANLVAFAGNQRDFDQSRSWEFFQSAVTADRFFGVPVAAFRELLFQRILIPHEKVAPRSRFWFRVAVNDGQIDPLSFPLLELVFQFSLRFRSLSENDDARRVAVDPVNDQRLQLFVGTQMVFDLVEQRRLAGLRGQRHSEQTGGFVNY